MPDKKATFDFLITQTISDIPEAEWNRLFGDKIIEGYGYHKTIEESAIKEFSPYYLIAKRQDSIVAIIPLFFNEFSLTTLIQGRVQRIIKFIQKGLRNFLKLRLIFIGLPTAEELYIGIEENQDFEAILDGALKKIETLLKEKRAAAMLFFNLSREQKMLAAYLDKKGYARMENFPNTAIELNYDCWQEYINSLSKNTRKDLRRKLNKFASLNETRTEILGNIDHIKNELFRLYSNNYDSSEVRFETLTPDFFQKICRNMPGVAKFFVTYNKDKIIAFNLCLIKEGACIDKFIGFDKELVNSYHLYQATFYHNINWCIKNNVRIYQMGITDYHPKLRLGCKLIPLKVYIKLQNRILNYLSGFVIRFIEPKRFDPVLKDISLE